MNGPASDPGASHSLAGGKSPLSVVSRSQKETLPSPIYEGDAADWRCCWTRFLTYIEDGDSLDDDSKLGYPLHCLKDDASRSIIIEGLRNRQSFEEVAAEL